MIKRARRLANLLRPHMHAGTSAPGRSPFDALLELERSGAAPLRAAPARSGDPLHVAAVIPSFRRGSGGHATIVNLLTGLRELGHDVSLWLEDCDGRHRREGPEVTRKSFAEFFTADELRLETSFDAWAGADVAVATGWQTVARTLLLRGAGGRAYLVQDHEPDFYGASAEALWAERTYRLGLHCIAASQWLAELLADRYGASASHFELAVDHETYRPAAVRRRDDLVIFYARAATPRRAVPLGLLALDELARRRPEVEIALFGEAGAARASFAHRNLGILAAGELAALYSEATVGVVLSLTNPSLVGLEMMACGLPCIDLASASMTRTFGVDGPVRLAPVSPLGLSAEIELLLDQPERRARASADGTSYASARTWHQAATQLERGLRAAVTRPAHESAHGQ